MTTDIRTEHTVTPGILMIFAVLTVTCLQAAALDSDPAAIPPDEALGSSVETVAAALPKNRRHHPHSTRPDVPQPQRPVPSTPENVDTGRPIEEWQHASDDWDGTRPWLDDQGITFEASLTADWSSNFDGGVNTDGSAFRHLFLANLTLDTERLIGHEGGTLFINFMNQNGEDGSADVGDFQAFSNIDADGRTQIAELWYEQRLFDDSLRVKFGKVEANSEFAYTDNGGEFINSSMGFSPTVFVLPTYPDPAMSAIVFVNPSDNLYAGVGLFDGSLQEGVTTGSRGPKTFFSSPADLFLIGEAGITWETSESQLPGRLGLGAWHHTGSFARFDGGTEDGTTGFYLVFDQTLWRENPQDEDDGQGIGMFVQYGWADPQVSEAEHHIGIGFTWIGPFPYRNEDTAGLGASWVRFSDEVGAGFTDESEKAVELFYKVQVFQWVSVKPDIQYIVNPGGISLSDSLAGTLRVEVVF